VRDRVAIAWIVLASAGASGAACNAILGNDVHELAGGGTDGAAGPEARAEMASSDASKADSAAADAMAGAADSSRFDAVEEGEAGVAAPDATTAPDAGGTGCAPCMLGSAVLGSCCVQ